MGGIFEKPEIGIASDLDGVTQYVDSDTIFIGEQHG
jgi:hypothetical protein